MFPACIVASLLLEDKLRPCRRESVDQTSGKFILGEPRSCICLRRHLQILAFIICQCVFGGHPPYVLLKAQSHSQATHRIFHFHSLPLGRHGSRNIKLISCTGNLEIALDTRHETLRSPRLSAKG